MALPEYLGAGQLEASSSVGRTLSPGGGGQRRLSAFG